MLLSSRRWTSAVAVPNLLDAALSAIPSASLPPTTQPPKSTRSRARSARRCRYPTKKISRNFCSVQPSRQSTTAIVQNCGAVMAYLGWPSERRQYDDRLAHDA
jgi:hypothetical protein